MKASKGVLKLVDGVRRFDEVVKDGAGKFIGKTRGKGTWYLTTKPVYAIKANELLSKSTFEHLSTDPESLKERRDQRRAPKKATDP